jgi:hypothetical protein
MWQEDAGAWPLKAAIALALLLGPLVIIAMPQGKTADTVALKGVPKALVGFLGQQGKVALAAVALGRVADIAQLLVQKLLHRGRKGVLGFVRRRSQDQRPPFRRACRYCRSKRYKRARLMPSISHAWTSESVC